MEPTTAHMRSPSQVAKCLNKNTINVDELDSMDVDTLQRDLQGISDPKELNRCMVEFLRNEAKKILKTGRLV